MKDFDKCIEICDQAIEISKGGNYDYVKLGKAIARKAAARLAQGHYDEAIDLYKQSLLENGDPNVKDQLKKAEKAKKEDEERKMINPELAEELRKEGNSFYEKADYPNAVKTYTDGLKRDPKSKAIYANRSAAYIKLMEFPHAMKDAEKCIELDPNFAKAYLRKGTCHHFMKEYHKALEAFDRGLKLEPENKDLKESRAKTMQAINSSAYAGSGEHDEERLRHAAADPEIQLLMRDPRIVQVLKDMQENPAAAQGALRDPFINTAINKLIAAGIIKMG
jgi:stress-induced-phosphoprotein 1